MQTPKHTLFNPMPHLLDGPCQLNVTWWHQKPVNLSPHLAHAHTHTLRSHSAGHKQNAACDTSSLVLFILSPPLTFPLHLSSFLLSSVLLLFSLLTPPYTPAFGSTPSLPNPLLKPSNFLLYFFTFVSWHLHQKSSPLPPHFTPILSSSCPLFFSPVQDNFASLRRVFWLFSWSDTEGLFTLLPVPSLFHHQTPIQMHIQRHWCTQVDTCMYEQTYKNKSTG